MSDKPKRQVNRIWDEAERSRHGQQVRSRFARERDEKIRHACDVLKEMLDQGMIISQNELARRTGISFGFINKYLRIEIEKAKRQKQKSVSKPCTQRQINAVERELERLILLNHRLREQLDEQRQINKALLAQVASVVDLEYELELLRKQSRELLAHEQITQEKVVNLPVHNSSTQGISAMQIAEKKPIYTSKNNNQNESKGQTSNLIEWVETELSNLGIVLNSTLKRKIQSKSESAVLNAIEALKQALENGTVIHSPAGWLTEAIESEWVKNETFQPTSHHQTTVKANTTQPKPKEELASPEELKSLSSIFNKFND